MSKSGWARAALSHRICTGIPRQRPAKLIAELADPWAALRTHMLAIAGLVSDRCAER